MLENECAWCGDECDDSNYAIRTRNLTTVNDGHVTTYEPQTEKLFFCDANCSVSYLFGL